MTTPMTRQLSPTHLRRETPPAATAPWRRRLLERRRRLDTISTHNAVDDRYLHDLVDEIDGALERLDNGSFGRCQACDGWVEPERMLADPTSRLCLDCLGPQERRSLERDLELAAEIQKRLLPAQTIRRGGWEIYYEYRPLSLVSGDYCDVAETPSGLFFLFGDIAGKGIAASLLMSHLQAIFRSLVAVGLPLPDLLTRLNRMLWAATRATSYATLVAGHLDADGRVRLANCGHCPPLLLRASEPPQRVDAGGLPVGLFPDGKFAVCELRLGAGDLLFLYTDGVTEAERSGDGEYSLARLENALGATSARRTASSAVGSCLADLDAFLAGAPAQDDLTALAIGRLARGVD